jgi:hypothetical protein
MDSAKDYDRHGTLNLLEKLSGPRRRQSQLQNSSSHLSSSFTDLQMSFWSIWQLGGMHGQHKISSMCRFQSCSLAVAL